MSDTTQQIQDLELMFDRATLSTNQEPDLLAIETIVNIIRNDKRLSSFAAQKIKEKVTADNKKEVLQALDILDECMTKCSNVFHGEVGKFRFLNELIKLVSPKHMGDVTSKEIQCKILDLLLIWTIQYPQEHKIKEAYDLLIKQGVVHEPPKSIRIGKTSNSQSDFDSIPKELLLSKDPLKTQIANLMIQQIMEKAKRESEIKLKRGLELKKAMDNASLLNDMLNIYKSNEITEDEMFTIKELYGVCQSLLPTISRLAEDMHNNELLGEALRVNDCLLDITKRYNEIVNKNEIVSMPNRSVTEFSLLPKSPTSTQNRNALDELNEIFSNQVTLPIAKPLFVSDSDVLKPIQVPSSLQIGSDTENVLVDPIKPKPLQMIDNISDDLFKEVLNSDERQGSFKKAPVKLSLDMLAVKQQTVPLKNVDLDSIVNNLKTDLKCGTEKDSLKQCDDDELIDTKINDKDTLLIDDIDEIQECPSTSKTEITLKNVKIDNDCAQQPLSNFHIEIDSITPGDSPPRIVMDEPSGLKIMLHFAKDRPRDDISVIVITTTNHNSIAIKDYQFDASVSKPCKLRLQTASDSSLPGILPFRPPTKDITQIMLLSNKERVSPKITCIVSYCLENDPDPIKESFTITDLPNN